MSRLARRSILVVPMAVALAVSAFRLPPQPQIPITTIGQVAAQLGVKVPSRADEEFSLGVQFTGTLVDSAKLAGYGILGMHPGARVVAARIAADRVHVEADELEPPSRGVARLSLDADGKLVRPPRT